jgi:protein-S-isoprenylcysteine O-methyltransferase Ste14
MLAVAWGGAALFLVSLTYFAYFYLMLLGGPVSVPTETASAALATNVALFTIFALHHSLFARLGLKARVVRVVAPGLERSLYVWLASLLFLTVCVFWQPVPGLAWRAVGAQRWLLHAVQLGGLVLTLKSASRIDIWELAGVRQARATRRSSAPSVPSVPSVAGISVPSVAGISVPSVAGISVPSVADISAPSVAGASAGTPAEQAPLTISGPYRWLRHPIYLGWVMFVFGAPEMTAGRLLFATISTVYLIVAIPYEERSLAAEFGSAYCEYQRQVRWRLVPGVW